MERSPHLKWTDMKFGPFVNNTHTRIAHATTSSREETDSGVKTRYTYSTFGCAGKKIYNRTNSHQNTLCPPFHQKISHSPKKILERFRESTFSVIFLLHKIPRYLTSCHRTDRLNFTICINGQLLNYMMIQNIALELYHNVKMFYSTKRNEVIPGVYILPEFPPSPPMEGGNIQRLLNCMEWNEKNSVIESYVKKELNRRDYIISIFFHIALFLLLFHSLSFPYFVFS